MKFAICNYTKEDALKFGGQMSSWSRAQPIIAKLTNEITLAKMIKYELDHQNREIIVRRLKTRFNKIRDQREMKEIEEYVKTKKRVN